jgi:hypothetical protein
LDSIQTNEDPGQASSTFSHVLKHSTYTIAMATLDIHHDGVPSRKSGEWEQMGGDGLHVSLRSSLQPWEVAFQTRNWPPKGARQLSKNKYSWSQWMLGNFDGRGAEEQQLGWNDCLEIHEAASIE